MLSPDQVLHTFDDLRRAQNKGRYAPHKPLLILLALARLQQGEPREVSLSQIEPKLKELLTEFGPTNAELRRHLPFWHLGTDHGGALWGIRGPAQLINRPPRITPTLGELRQPGVYAGFVQPLHDALQQVPGLLVQVAKRVLEAYFPETLHADIVAEVGLDLSDQNLLDVPEVAAARARGIRRDPAFRQKVLMAYEYRCCVCGFDLRVGHLPAGLEGAHIQWHSAGGPDIEANGLSLCALHHKLFDLGAFTVEAEDLRVIFSQHAIAGNRGLSGSLSSHGQRILLPPAQAHRPAGQYLKWNLRNVFKGPGRTVEK